LLLRLRVVVVLLSMRHVGGVIGEAWPEAVYQEASERW
jgi:asparagine synthetase A